ncbi:hypothetical protein [Leucobacter sp. wl10]|uniref:DUF6993 domain-containing protein n=1 Tax=Leucobacter sp. wl10 TaxID=2304677 RepID=UPI000E5B589B|nr:hypothetical protein [Leucobacter sp. wl10]RGE22523.1 hypothetical protein D1J51_04755 [Leucobacter sp. wl10]
MRSALPSSRRPRAAALLSLCIALPLLAGCSLLAGPTPQTPPRETPKSPETAPQFVPGGTAEQNLPAFTEALRVFSASQQPVTGAPVVDAVAAVGFDKTAMQVSFDETKTGLAADSIYVSVRIGADCLVGQVVAEDRSFVAKQLPAVGPGGDICLIGNTRPIDW